MQTQENQLNFDDLSVEELEQLINQLQQPQQTTEPSETKPEPEPEQKQETVVQPNTPVVPQDQQDLDKLIRTLADLSEEELAQWAYQNGPEGLAVLMKVQQYKITQQLQNQTTEQMRQRLGALTVNFFKENGIDPQKDVELVQKMDRYITGAVMQRGGLQNFTESEFRQLLEEAKNIFAPQIQTQKQKQPEGILSNALRTNNVSPTDLSGQSAGQPLNLEALSPAQLEELLSKYDPEDLLQ